MLNALNKIKNWLEPPNIDSNVIRMYLGKTGSGKTVLQTEEWVLPALLAGEEVWCCYWVNWNLPNYHYFAPRDLDKIMNLRNSMIVFDEIRRSLDPRQWESESDEVRSFFELHRHRHNDIIGNTQDVSLVAKTVGVQAHSWVLVDRIEDGFFKRLWRKLTYNEGLTFHKQYLSFQELKKMAAGWELGEEIGINAEFETIKMPFEALLHRELEEYKQEIVHRYCPKCKSRQGEQIKKEDTGKYCTIKDGKWVLIEEEYCPKHKDTLLIIKESSMFDTDYEPETVEKEITWKPFMKSPEGWRLIEYKGALSKRQAEYKTNLNQKESI